MTSLTDQLFFEHLPGCGGCKDVNRKYVGANKHLLLLKKLPHVEEILGKTDDDISPDFQEENTIFYEQDLKVLNGEKISTIHVGPFTKIIYLLEKKPLIDHNKNISGIIFYCRPWEEIEFFHLINQLDTKLNIATQNYTIDHHQNIFRLTERECECVFLLIRSKTAKEIATILSLSKRTVESYIENIKNKMHCQKKSELIVKAISSGYQHLIPSRLNQLHLIKSL